VTAIGFRHQDTYPLSLRKALRYLCRIYEEHLIPTPMRYFPQPSEPSLIGSHEKLGTARPPRRPFVPHSCLPRLPVQTL
jgi:hypothetical protein